MLKIKLFPKGKKHQRTFRIVVSEARSKSNGKFVDDLGFFTPQTKTIEYDKEKFAIWLKNGAQVTLGVDRLLNPDKYPKKVKVKPEKVVKEPKVIQPAEIPVEEKTIGPTEETQSETKVETEIKVEITETKSVPEAKVDTPIQPEAVK
jgi:small subunit ribosomal protein S16